MDSKGNSIAASIRRIAHAEDVPVLGIAPAAALADEPPGRRPEDLLPGAPSASLPPSRSGPGVG